MPKQPILWCRLGSATELVQPPVGPVWTNVNNATYVSNKFGNGLYCASSQVYAKSTLTSSFTTEKGCIECWVKLNYALINSDIQVNGVYIFSVATSIGGTDRIYILPWGDNNKIYAFVGGAFAAFGGTSLNLGANELAHWALVWDRSGINGTLEKVQLYVNGAKLGGTTTSPTYYDLNNNVFVAGNIASQAQQYPIYGSLDNLKWYDYAKTDFRDRFNERGGMNDQIILG